VGPGLETLLIERKLTAAERYCTADSTAGLQADVEGITALDLAYVATLCSNSTCFYLSYNKSGTNWKLTTNSQKVVHRAHITQSLKKFTLFIFV